ncbi:MAG: sigma-70 family RNA polymerase sigma factor [Planctomycetes bacterium]|nr:sigma-70 family RNA polymerase sigma factor [Planctomycetota bacterium]
MQGQLENISIDDAALVRQCQKGDSAAMHRLIVKYQDRIYNVVLKISGNRDDAAELTQETFVKVIEKVETFGYRSTFYTWLFRIAVNLTLNYCSRSNKMAMRSLDTTVSGDGEDCRRQLGSFLVDNKSSDPIKLAQRKETIEIVTQALSELDDQQRTIVVLRDIEQMAYIEIAEAMDLELGTVKSRLSRARKNLRKILEAMLK